MSSEEPLTTAWAQIRERVQADAATYRERGESVCVVFADHGAVTQSTEGPVNFSFTIPGDTATELEDHIGDRSVSQTEVQYVDVDQVRFYVLDISDRTAERRILLAGAVRHQPLLNCLDASGAARTVLRSVTGDTVLELQHGSVRPFLTELD